MSQTGLLSIKNQKLTILATVDGQLIIVNVQLCLHHDARDAERVARVHPRQYKKFVLMEFRYSMSNVDVSSE